MLEPSQIKTPNKQNQTSKETRSWIIDVSLAQQRTNKYVETNTIVESD